jgi:hypothetical protein
MTKHDLRVKLVEGKSQFLHFEFLHFALYARIRIAMVMDSHRRLLLVF